MSTDPATTPLRRDPEAEEKHDLQDIETSNLTEHYILHTNGIYGDRQYADISLILKGRNLNG